jgi:hypothetical protein
MDFAALGGHTTRSTLIKPLEAGTRLWMLHPTDMPGVTNLAQFPAIALT